MKTYVKWIAVAASLTVLCAGIGRAIVHRKAEQSELSQSTASSIAESVLLGESDVFTAGPRLLTRSIPVSGTLTAQRSAIVKSKVAAELLDLDVREGDTVSESQVIGKLDAQEYETRLQQARQQAASAKAQWQIAQQNLDNNRALVQQGFISRSALDTSESNASAAKATYEAAQSAVDLAHKGVKDTVVRAPIGGFISQRFVQAGERLNVDGRIVEIVDLDSLELQAPVTATDVLQLRIGAAAKLHIDGLDAPVKARVARINPSASAETRAVMVYLALPHHTSLRQGLFAQGRILLDERQALAVPLSAIVRDSGQDEVLSIEGGKVVKRKVVLGPHGGDSEAQARAPDGASATGAANTASMAPDTYVEIIDGLKPGDRILRRAGGTIREGQAVTLAPTLTAR